MIGLVEALRWRRKELGLSQRALAERVGCHENTICRMENRQERISVELCEGVCQALGLELWRLLKANSKAILADQHGRRLGGML